MRINQNRVRSAVNNSTHGVQKCSAFMQCINQNMATRSAVVSRRSTILWIKIILNISLYNCDFEGFMG